MAEANQKPIKVFCSYSHNDESYLRELKTNLAGLRRQGLIQEWHDREILPGQEWEAAIDEVLKTSEIILLLITPTFVNSDFAYEKEMKRALERHERGEARVIPIIVRPTDWEWAPFGKLQALPKNAEPVTRWPERDAAWVDVVRGIRKAVKELTDKPRGEPTRQTGDGQNALRRYRDTVEWVWTEDEEFHRRKAERLKDLASRLGLSPSTAADIERDVMGDTKEAILERQEQATRGKHREVCPYRGLDTFAEEHARFFFGRQRVVRKLLRELRGELSFLTVVGPSGSGKSSVVQAGLIPQLRRGRLPGIKDWGVVIVSCYDNPYKRLVAAGLEDATEDLVNGTEAWLIEHPEHDRLLLVLDQFEQLLVACPESLRHDLIAQLVKLLDSPLDVTVVLVVQEGFYERLVQQAPELARHWLPESLVEVLPNLRNLKQEELISIIQEPAKSAGLGLEDGLVERIIEDAIEVAPDEGEDYVACSTVLPLLEYALSRLWELRHDGMLTHKAYDEIEGLTGDLALWAAQAYAKLGDDLQPLARRVLTDLVTPGDESQKILLSRKRRPLAGLYHEESESEAVQQVVQRLAKARVLVTAYDRQSSQDYVEIIHDALLREWKRLRRWLEDRRFTEWRHGIEKRAKNWLESCPDDPMRREESELLGDHELAEADEWLSKRITDLSQPEQEFIDASKAHEQLSAARKEYRKAVAEAWTDRKLNEAEVEQLKDLASNRLNLSPNTSAEIEREVMDNTMEAILERQNGWLSCTLGRFERIKIESGKL